MNVYHVQKRKEWRIACKSRLDLPTKADLDA